jgi:hypothetical protein
VALGPGSRHRARPFFGLFLGLRLRDSIPLLNSPDQLVLPAGYGFSVILGELAPAVACRTGETLPFAFYLVPNACSLLILSTRARLPPFFLRELMGLSGSEGRLVCLPEAKCALERQILHLLIPPSPGIVACGCLPCMARLVHTQIE